MKGNTGMTTNSSTNEDEIEDLVEEGWKSKLSAWGLSAVGCAVWFRSRFVFPYIYRLQITPTSRLILACAQTNIPVLGKDGVREREVWGEAKNELD